GRRAVRRGAARRAVLGHRHRAPAAGRAAAPARRRHRRAGRAAGASARRRLAGSRARRRAALCDLLDPARGERRPARRLPRAHARCGRRAARRVLRPRLRGRAPAAAGRRRHGRLLLRAPASRLRAGRRASDGNPTPPADIIRAMTKATHSRDFWLLAVFALLVLATGIGLREPWPADEPRFVLVAKQMWESGDWWFPRRGLELYPDKPPLFFWLLGASYALVRNWTVAFLLPSL